MRYHQPFDKPSDPNASYVNANPATGTRGSILDIVTIEQLQREVLKVITEAGLTPNDNDLTQLWQAIVAACGTIANETIVNALINNNIDVAIPAGTAGGTANALTVTLAPAPVALYDKLLFIVKFGPAANTAAATIDPNGLGVTPIKRVGGATLQPGDLPANGFGIFIYDLPTTTAVLVANGGIGGTPTQSLSGARRNYKAIATGLNSNIVITADELIVKSAAHAYQTLRGINLTINAAAVGANGLDTGVLQPNTWYATHVAWNGAASCGLLSLSATAPTLPGGYTHSTRTGWLRTDGSGNKYPLAFLQTDFDVDYIVTGPGSGNVPDMPIMVVGGAVAWTPIGVDNFVPPTATKIRIMLGAYQGSWTAAAPNPSYDNAILTGASYTAPLLGFINIAWGQINQMAEFMLQSRYVYYSGGANNTIPGTTASQMKCTGWRDC
ncbi:MAG: hypothetical protein AB7U62_03025 [Pseudolabrys sp.]